jgi:capsular exopolysaccharide synthesis family protein
MSGHGRLDSRDREGAARVDLTPALALVRRRWVSLLACLLLGVLGGGLAYEQTPATYQSTSRIFFNLPSTPDVAAQAQGFQLTTELLQSYARIATSRSAADAISRSLQGVLSPSEVQDRISATPEQQTLLLDVAATGPSPAAAQQLAVAATNNLVAQIGELESVKAVQIKPQVVDAAEVSNTPISPRKKVDFGLGLALGIVGGLLAALLADSLDRRVRGAAQVAALTGLPEIGRTPKSRGLAKSPLHAWGPEGGDLREAYRTVRTAVQFLRPDAPPRSILVTSPAIGEGKTTTALNLAIALAASGETVILVDADLRRAGLSAALGLDRAGGLSAAIRDPSAVGDFLLPGPQERLQVLSAGTLPPDPSEMLGSQNMAALVIRLTDMADVVVFDCAPVMPVTDAVTFATQVDAVLLVVRERVTMRHDVAETVRRLETVGARAAGFILNGVPGRTSSGYVYGPETEAPRRLFSFGSRGA